MKKTDMSVGVEGIIMYYPVVKLVQEVTDAVLVRAVGLAVQH